MKKKVGILGGMGPETTAIFYHLLIKECQLQFGFEKERSYPDVYIQNVAMPEIIEEIEESDANLQTLVREAKILEDIGVDIIVMACNSAHYFYPEVVKEIQTPFLHIAEEVAKEINANKLGKVGLIATRSTIKNRIYQDIFEKRNIGLVLPEDPGEINSVILKILGRTVKMEDIKRTVRIAKSLKKEGAEGIILGCTDLQIIFGKVKADIPIFDSLEVLAKSTIGHIRS